MDCVTCGFQSDLTWKGCDSLLSFANRGGGGDINRSSLSWLLHGVWQAHLESSRKRLTSRVAILYFLNIKIINSDSNSDPNSDSNSDSYSASNSDSNSASNSDSNSDSNSSPNSGFYDSRF